MFNKHLQETLIISRRKGDSKTERTMTTRVASNVRTYCKIKSWSEKSQKNRIGQILYTKLINAGGANNGKTYP